MGALGRPFLCTRPESGLFFSDLNRREEDYLVGCFSFGKQLMEKPSII